MRRLRIEMVSIEEGLSSLGFRRVAAVARRFEPSARIRFVPVGNLYSPLRHLFPGGASVFGDADCRAIAAELADADLICLSSMTPSAPHVEVLTRCLRDAGSRAFLVWGGAHCILSPERAIEHVDAVCVGEGELVIEELCRAIANGSAPLSIDGLWLRTPDGVVRNPGRPLLDGAALGRLPLPYDDYDCLLYDAGARRFRDLTRSDYIRFNGLSYRTVWTRGCPFRCAYCANSGFLAVNRDFRRIRRVPVDRFLEELEKALAVHPQVSTFAFYDDHFVGLPLSELEAFAAGYRARIGLPFVVFGMHPSLLTARKVDLLCEAGMNRTRMGIQSFSARTLEFYRRTTPVDRIRVSARIVVDAARDHRMIPPAFDILSDNPVESREDVIETLRNLYELPRPYTLNVFSLRVFEKTQLWHWFAEHPEAADPREASSYLDTRPTLANVLLYLLGTARPPRAMFEWLLGRVRGTSEPQEAWPTLLLLARAACLARRGMSHLRRLDFTTLGGIPAEAAWRLGLVRPDRGRTTRPGSA